MSLSAANTYPERIAAAASFHGGRLASDTPDSPHLLAPRRKARVDVAGAIEDQHFPDAMKARLEEALTGAGVDHKIETYPARHGWVLSDTPVHDAQQTERHWTELIALFRRQAQACVTVLSPPHAPQPTRWFHHRLSRRRPSTSG